MPVKLRRGGRSLGGSLTWEKPQHLAAFAADGPFAGLAVPKDVTVNRQVLAEPDAVLATKSWASLEDGTPLVTGERRGKGVVSLFHVSADMRWSDLPMSGTFVEMLRRIVDMSGYTANPGAGVGRRGHHGDGGAAAHARRFRRVRPAALDRKAAARGLPRPRQRGSSAGLLRPGRRPARGQYAGGRRSHRAARRVGPARRAAAATPIPSRATCAAFCCRRRWLLFLIDAIIVALLGAGLAALLRRRAGSAALAFAVISVGADGCAVAVACRREG